MATILEFRNVPGRSRLNFSRGQEQAAGQIVIFPGVRVAYWQEAIAEADDTPPPPRSATRKNGKSRRQKS